MPSVIASTTPRALGEAIVSTIMAIVPSEESNRDAGWTPTEANRVEGNSSMVPRMYWIEVFPGGLVPSGITGNGDAETYLTLDIVVDYRVFEPQELGHIVAADQWDLYDAIEEQINIIPGLTQVSVSSEPSFEGDEGQMRVRYPMMLQYMRARRF